MRRTPRAGNGCDLPYAAQSAQLFLGLATQAAVAAQFATVQLLNPAGLGIAVVVHAIRAYAGAAALGRLVIHNTARTTAVSQIQALRPVVNNSAAAMYKDSLAALGAAFSEVSLTTTPSGLYTFDPVIILDPGFGVELECELANTALTAEFIWQEG
jgi:hypothetical protein